MAGAGINLSDTARDSNPAKLKARQDLTQLSAQARKAWITAVAAASVGLTPRSSRSTAGPCPGA